MIGNQIRKVWLAGIAVQLVVVTSAVGDMNGNVTNTAEELRAKYKKLPYLLNETNTGTPVPVVFDGKLILEGDPDGVHCSGFTFAVAMRAMEAGRSKNYQLREASHMREFQKEWFVRTDDSSEKGPVYAMKNLGLGKEIYRFAEAQAGDFVQLWRNDKARSGHSVVLLEVIRAKRQVIGIRYISANKKKKGDAHRDGIGERTEYFSDNKPYQETSHAGGGRYTVTPPTGKLQRGRVYIGRLFD